MTAIKVADNLAAIRERVAAACLKSGRSEQAAGLVAVSKRIPTPLVVEAVAAGQRDLGENRLPEAVDRQPEVARALAEAGVEKTGLIWHFIGQIQSRKAAQAVGQFTLLHAVDTLKLVRKLSKSCVAGGLNQRILLEVNITGEEQKHGFAPDQLIEAVVQAAALPGLKVDGLMCMARYGADEAELHGTFARLRTLAEDASRQCQVALPELSMGMSGDFEIAIAEGATLVRVGSAIFGPRQY